jgi:RHS repeat-associated protein
MTTYTYAPGGERLTMTLPGSSTPWTYKYVTQADIVANYTLDFAVLPKDDLNTICMALKSITDDQGRRVDFDLTGGGWVMNAMTNETWNTTNNPPLLCTYQQTFYTYALGNTSLYTNQMPNLTVSGTCEPWITQMQTTWNVVASPAQTNTSLLWQNNYTYDSSGQRLTNTTTDNNNNQRTETYSYDCLNRLSGVNYGDGEWQTYTFDAMGNRLTKTDNQTGNEGYSYDNANRLVNRTIGGNNNPYTFDANGNTLTGGGRTCTWDSENRMATCAYSGNNCSYLYAADGLRHRSTVNGTVTNFVLDGSMAVRELNAALSSTATYLIGPRGPEGRRDDTAGTSRWYIYDGLGCVVGEVDPGGNLQATRKYDVYGYVRGSTGTSNSKQKFVGALGHPSEQETGLVYMGARYMDPAIGRFTSEDPGRNGSNWLVYGSDNPVDRVDSSGCQDVIVALLYIALSFFNQYMDATTGVTAKGTIMALRDVLRGLRMVADAARMVGEAEIEEGATVAGSGAYLGAEGATLSERIAEIEQGLGSMSLAEGAAAKLAIDVVQDMIEMVD